MTMGNRIAAARKDKGFTQEYVAASLGVSRQAVFKWEKDQSRPDTKNLFALSELMGVSAEYLINGIDSNKAENHRWRGKAFFMTSFILLLILPVCWLIGMFSGEYTDMVQIPLPGGDGLGIPFLMYGHSPAAIVLVGISILSLILSVLMLILGYYANKYQE